MVKRDSERRFNPLGAFGLAALMAVALLTAARADGPGSVRGGLQLAALLPDASRHSPPSAAKGSPRADRADRAEGQPPDPSAASITATESVDLLSANLGDTLNYTVLIANSGTDATGVTFSDTLDANSTLVAGSVQSSPVAVDDAYTCTGNLSISVPAGSGLLANDYMGLNPSATIAAYDSTSPNGGTVSVNPDGSFSYEPAAGFTGTDIFLYTLCNFAGCNVGMATITVSNRIWFINNASSCSSSCDGRLSHPFTSLSAFISAGSGNMGDRIFIYSGSGGYPGTLSLKLSQRLIGQGDALNATTLGFTPASYGPALPGAGAKPTLTGTLNVANSTTVLAVDWQTTTGVAIAGVGVSGVTINDQCTVTATNGVALYLNNADGNFTFRSISASGNQGGIVWNNATQATGSLTITSDGASVGSGGTIQNIWGSDGNLTGYGCGIYLNKASNVSLSRMQLNDFQNYAIRGFSVNNFTMDRCDITGVNGNNPAYYEGSVSFGASTGEPGGPANGLTGTATISNCSISGGLTDNIRLANQSGTLNRLTLSSDAISGAGNHGVFIQGESAAIVNVTATGCTLSSAYGDHLRFLMNGSNSANLIFQNNTVTNPAPYGTTGTGGVTLISGNNVGGGANTTFNLSSNTLRDARADAIHIEKRLDPGTLSGTLANNTIGLTGTANSGSALGSGVWIQNDGLGTLTTNIQGNHIYQYNWDGITVTAGGMASSGSLNLTAQSNNVIYAGTNGGVINGIKVTAGTTAGDSFAVCALFESNFLDNGSQTSSRNGGYGISLAQRMATTVALPGYAGANNDNTAVQNWEWGQNMGLFAALATNTVGSGGGGFTNGSCALPSTFAVPVTGDAAPRDENLSALTGERAAGLLPEALVRLTMAGVPPETLSRLEKVPVHIGDLPANLLAQVFPGEIVLDRTASGRGWFVDETPWDDSEFEETLPDGRMRAVDFSPANSGVDLLSVLLSSMNAMSQEEPGEEGADLEMDRGRGDGEAGRQDRQEPSPSRLLLESCSPEPGIRCLPLSPRTPSASLPEELAPDSGTVGFGAQAAPIAATRFESGETVNLTIGTLPGGKSVTVKFAATIANPLNVPATQATNQCTVSGSNFSAVTSNTATTAFTAPDISVTMTDGGSATAPGGVVLYQLFVQNTGGQSATGVSLTIVVPVNTVFDLGNSNGAWSCPNGSPAGTLCTLSLGTFAPGESNGMVIFAVQVVNPVPAGVTQISSTVAASDDGTHGVEPTPANNSASDTTPVTAAPDLVLAKTDGKSSVSPSETVPYTLTFTNSGNQGASGVTLTETVPINTVFNAAASSAGWSCANGSPGGTNCTLSVGNLAGGGASGSRTFAVNVLPGASGSVSNTAAVADDGSNGIDPTPANNSATDTDTVDAQADLSVTKTDGVTTAVPGGSVIYTITASNAGPSSVSGATLADTLPAVLTGTWTCAGAGGGTCTAAGAGNISDTVNLPAGGSVTYTVSATISASATGTLSNTATVAAPAGVTDPAPGNNSATDTDTLAPPPDLSITKSDGGASVIPGGTVAYTLTYANTGTTSATGVVLRETVPANTTFNPGASTAGWVCVPNNNAGSTGTLAVGTLAGGGGLQSATFAVTVVNQVAAGVAQISNTAHIADDGAHGTDPNPGNNMASDTTPVNAAPDLSISKSDGGASVAPGGTVAYTLMYANTGNQGSAGVVLTETVPANTTFNPGASTAGWVCSPNNNAGSTCTLAVGGLAAGGGPQTATFAVTVVNPVAGGVAQISNAASIADDGANGSDPTPGNNTGGDTTPVTGAPDLSITKSDGGASVIPGGTVAYILTYANTGNRGATGVVLTETVPANTTFNPGASTAGWVCVPNNNAGSTCTLAVGGLAAGGGPQSATFAMKVDSPLPAGITQISNTASIADDGANGTDPTPGNNTGSDTTPVTPTSDLSIAKTDSPDPVIAGQNITYTITMSNNGPSDAQTVTVTDAVPANTTFVSAAVTTGSGWTTSAPAVGGTGNVVFSKASVAAGETAVFTVVVNVNVSATDGSTVTNTATAASATMDPTPGNNAASTTTTVNAQADLAVVKTGPATVTPGGTITYAVTLTNNGPGAALNVTLGDLLPAPLTFVSQSQTSGPPFVVGNTGNQITDTLATLAAGASASFQVTAAVSTGAAVGSVISNTATASSAIPDPSPSNNSSTATTTVLCPAVTLTPGTLPGGTAGAAYSQTISANPAGTTYAYAVTAGSLPPGLTLDTNSGALTGTPTTNGTYTFTITASGWGTCSGSQAYTITIACPTITLAALANGTANTVYTSSATASPTGTYTYAITTGSLPPGLALNTTTGAMTGTPTTNGTYNFTITAAGWGTCTGSQAYAITIACPAITLAALGNGTANTAYSSSAVASPAGTTYTYAVTAGSLPPGLTLNPATGDVTGTPTTNGAYNFTITATGWGTCMGSQAFTVTIACPAITLSPASPLPGSTVGTVPYTQTFATFPAGTTYAYAVTAGALPPGLTLNLATGTLAGTVTAAGNYSFTVTATGWGTCTGSRTYSLTAVCPSISVSPASLPGALAGTPYAQTLTASGGVAPYTYLVTGGALPGGLTLNPNGTLTGTPTTGGTFTFTVTATDANGCAGSITYTVVIAAFDLTFYDDNGNSALCANSATGAFTFTILRGFGIGSYTGAGNITRFNGTLTLQTPSGLPYSLTLKYLERYHKATAAYKNPPLRIQSTLTDTNTLNDPPVCAP